MSPLLQDKPACFLITIDKRRLSITAASGLLSAYLLLAVQQLEKPLLQIHRYLRSTASILSPLFADEVNNVRGFG